MSAALKISSLVRGWAAAAAPSQGLRALSTVTPAFSAAATSFEVRFVNGSAIGSLLLDPTRCPAACSLRASLQAFSSSAAVEALHGASFAAPSSSTNAVLRKPFPSRGAPSAHASGFHSSPAASGSFSTPVGGSSGAALHPHPLHLVPASPPQGASAAGGAAGAGGWQSWAAPGGRGSLHPGRRFFASPTLRSGAVSAPAMRSTPLLSVAPEDAALAHDDDEPRLCVP